jgi:hypothetical protein
VTLRAPDGGAGLSFQPETAYVPPAWPAGPGDQQMMLHLDFERFGGRRGQSGSGRQVRGLGR